MFSKLKEVLIIICLFTTNALSGHELNFGLFDLYEDQNGFYLEIRLDKMNTLQAIRTNNVYQTIETLECELTEYLDNNLSLAFNSQAATLDYIAISSDEQIVVIHAKIEVPYQVVSEIKVSNTVLLSIVENQKNIIKASFHERKRSFRLSADRTSTLIKY